LFFALFPSLLRPAALTALRRGCAQFFCTPLHWAANNDNVACVVALCERGANKQAKNDVRPALFCAPPSVRLPLLALAAHTRRRVRCAGRLCVCLPCHVAH
jgi:hypothetical protein